MVRRDSHSDSLVIACRSEHTVVCRVPGNGVNATGGVSFEGLDERAVLLVPNVDSGI